MKRTVTKLTDREIYNNLKSYMFAATNEEWTEGKNWYFDAQVFCKSLAKQYDIDSYKVAAVVSALSPNNKWERNKIDAEAVIVAFKNGLTADSVKVCTYNANKRKAFEILYGNIEITAKSPKTHSFAMNVGLNSPDHITIDKWHLRACVASYLDGVQECMESCTAVQYRRIEAITADLAKAYNLKGYELQAIIWVTIKRTWNR